MTAKELQELLDSYDMGMTTANEIVDMFIALNDKSTETHKVNPVTAAIVQERDRLLAPLAEKCASILRIVAGTQKNDED